MFRLFKSKIKAFWFNPRASENWLIKSLSIGLITGVAFLGITYLGILQSWELSLFDWFLVLRPDPEADKRLLVVGITEDDIARFFYPVSDKVVTQALKKLQQNQPSVIGIDIFRDVPIGEGKKDLTDFLKDTKNNNVVAVCGMSSITSSGVAPPPSIDPAQVGFADLDPDDNNIERRTALVSSPLNDTHHSKHLYSKHLCNDTQQILHSFAYLLATTYLTDAHVGINAQIQEPEGGAPNYSKLLKINSTLFPPLSPNAGGYHNLEAGDYQILLNYRSRIYPSPIVSLSDLLDNKVDPQLIHNRIVLFGYTADSVKDSLLTPYSASLRQDKQMPGVVVHAQIVSQIVSSVVDHRPLIWYLPEWLESLWVIGWSIVGGLLTWRRLGILSVLGWALVTIGILFGVCWTGFILSAAWFPLIPSALALVVTGSIVLITDRLRLNPEIDLDNLYQQESKEKNRRKIENHTNFLKKLQEEAQKLKRILQDFDKNVQDSKVVSPNWLVNFSHGRENIEGMGLYWRKLTSKPLLLSREEKLKSDINLLLSKSEELRNRFKETS